MKRLLTGYALWFNRRYGLPIPEPLQVYFMPRGYLLCYWAVRELGVTMTSLSRLLNISVQAIGNSVIRGEKLSRAKKYSVIGK